MYFRYSPILGNGEKKYKAIICRKDGTYRAVKPYINVAPVPFYEANGNPVYTSTQEQLYVYSNGMLKSIDDLLIYDEAGELITQ